jgi:Glyoxalase-like domain
MHLDHLSFAAGPEGLQETSEHIGGMLGATFYDGGFHPQFGTRNRILPLVGGHYLEVVEVLDHPAAEKAPFGQAVRARSLRGGGWLCWVVAVDDLDPVEARIGRPPFSGHRHLPDGGLLEWQQLGIRGLQADPQLPFFVKWLSSPDAHPSAGGRDVELIKIEIAGEHARVDEWLGGQAAAVLSDIRIEWTSPDGAPGLTAAVFNTRHGQVRI